MISFPPRPRSTSYTLTSDLEGDFQSNSLLPIASNEVDREELLIRKLGAKGWGRLHHFRNYYSTGWGDGHGRPLSPRSLEAFYRFLEAAHFSDAQRPSLFLTDEGHLELCWEDLNGKAVQVEFTPSGAEYFVEATGAEGDVAPADLAALAGKLAA
jgi:hypothetical protein